MEKQLYAGWEIRQWSGTQARDGVECKDARLKVRDRFYGHGNARMALPIATLVVSSGYVCMQPDDRALGVIVAVNEAVDADAQV